MWSVNEGLWPEVGGFSVGAVRLDPICNIADASEVRVGFISRCLAMRCLRVKFVSLLIFGVGVNAVETGPDTYHVSTPECVGNFCRKWWRPVSKFEGDSNEWSCKLAQTNWFGLASKTIMNYTCGTRANMAWVVRCDVQPRS